jgi:hypothetical protein
VLVAGNIFIKKAMPLVFAVNLREFDIKWTINTTETLKKNYFA